MLEPAGKKTRRKSRWRRDSRAGVDSQKIGFARTNLPRSHGDATSVSALTTRSETITFAIRIFERLRLYSPLGLLFEPGTSHMPPDATTPMPVCLLCNKKSKLPSSHTGWLQADDEPRLYMVCGDCGFDRDEAEIQRNIVEKVTEPIAAGADVG
jgi:hypothetical protein